MHLGLLKVKTPSAALVHMLTWLWQIITHAMHALVMHDISYSHDLRQTGNSCIFLTGGTQALTEASAALRQTATPHGGNHLGPTQEAAQHNTAAHGHAATAQNDSSDLPAFLSGQPCVVHLTNVYCVCHI